MYSNPILLTLRVRFNPNHTSFASGWRVDSFFFFFWYGWDDRVRPRPPTLRLMTGLAGLLGAHPRRGVVGVVAGRHDLRVPGETRTDATIQRRALQLACAVCACRLRRSLDRSPREREGGGPSVEAPAAREREGGAQRERVARDKRGRGRELRGRRRTPDELGRAREGAGPQRLDRGRQRVSRNHGDMREQEHRQARPRAKVRVQMGRAVTAFDDAVAGPPAAKDGPHLSQAANA